MSSTLNPTKIDPKDVPTVAPDVVVTRVDHDVARSQPNGKTAPAVAHKDAAAGAKAPPVDTTFRAASAEPVEPARERVQRSFGRRLVRGAIGMILTACVAGAVVLWQSHGDAVRQIVTKSVSPLVMAVLSRVGPGGEQPSDVPEVQASAVPEASASQQPAGNVSSSATSPPPPDATELLHSLARELAHIRQDMDQMKGAIAELKASDEQMAREIAKASDRATDKALEQALRPRVSMVSQPPVQAVAMAARRPPVVARSGQPRPVSVTPQVATSYASRPAEARAMAPSSSAAAPPMDISAPRPPSPLREQTP